MRHYNKTELTLNSDSLLHTLFMLLIQESQMLRQVLLQAMAY